MTEAPPRGDVRGGPGRVRLAEQSDVEELAKVLALAFDDDPVTPELMYRLADLVTPALSAVVAWAGR